MIKDCPECGKPYWAGRNRQIYCSTICAGDASRNAISRINQECKQCKLFFNFRRLKPYCSQKCYWESKKGKYTPSLRRATAVKPFYNKIRAMKRWCKKCGKAYEVPMNRKESKAIYCSQECYSKDVKGIYKESLRKGHDTVRARPRVRHEGVCLNCGKTYFNRVTRTKYCNGNCYHLHKATWAKDEKGRFLEKEAE